ncbi:MAG: DUF1524 domain-containing protein [Chloroflexi bacterium]|nr:DUF1524 domain-containing protein [Chloroflexota bacterium]MCY3588485.1 DUF1524 domain-containing protein [Chloroflexota bacterium]MCY3686800.1 DUF1524 domain-containing protein [Chloroflexota bacterium]MDE2709409.1 DUF1524 domain-containing protein [Chloroflexota bacterium]
MQHVVAESACHHRLFALGLALVLAGLGLWFLLDQASAHGTCSTHHQYRVYDGTHDRDGDGVGCETLPEPPGGPPQNTSTTTTTATSGYDRDNWSFNSSSARAALQCDSTEHVDHIVALKEAYDSGASGWTSTRKRQFANDRANLWCLEAGVNLSKSDHDLAEWSGGSCEQRRHIATVTVAVKMTYQLFIDPAEQTAIEQALAMQCSTASAADGAVAAEIARLNGVTGFATWLSEHSTTAAALFAALNPDGAIAIFIWDGTIWAQYATVGGLQVPGSLDVDIEHGNILHITR